MNHFGIVAFSQLTGLTNQINQLFKSVCSERLITHTEITLKTEITMC